MIVLTVDEIILLHGKLLRVTDETPGLRDPGLLESAVLGFTILWDPRGQLELKRPKFKSYRSCQTGRLCCARLSGFFCEPQRLQLFDTVIQRF